ncbi:hypothetical protein QTN25_007664 [Entamoeba marina]
MDPANNLYFNSYRPAPTSLDQLNQSIQQNFNNSSSTQINQNSINPFINQQIPNTTISNENQFNIQQPQQLFNSSINKEDQSFASTQQQQFNNQNVHNEQPIHPIIYPQLLPHKHTCIPTVEQTSPQQMLSSYQSTNIVQQPHEINSQQIKQQENNNFLNVTQTKQVFDDTESLKPKTMETVMDESLLSTKQIQQEVKPTINENQLTKEMPQQESIVIPISNDVFIQTNTVENSMKEESINTSYRTIGIVSKNVENKSIIQGGNEVIDFGTQLFCNGNLVGVVNDVFGQITSPYYVIDGIIPIGSEICVEDKRDIFVDINKVNTYGTDASGVNDMELPEDEREFSDDEEERIFKRKKKMKKELVPIL